MKLPAGVKYLILAGVVGLVATVLIHRYITTKTVTIVRPTDQVVVATVEIEPGTALSGRMVSVATWPKEIIPANAIRSLEQLEGRVVQTYISKGEPVLTTKLAPVGTAAGLGGLLKPGLLALTIRTDEVSGVAGFIHPGDLVDVLAELPSPSGGGEHFSKVILQGLRVLSKGQITDQTGEKKPQVVTTVTLEVTPEQAEILNLASFQGKIRLALRNQLHKETYVTAGVVTSQLITKSPPPVAAAEETPKPQPEVKRKAEREVEVIKGMKRSSSNL
ncbi:MAG: Flp pilus assembly protein CpaB [Deltaproteobacteria bacterium]|nr:Flp pilus assembly protein CpaB [Deltaproteobacteria bacterium]